ncbi:MAG: hypothetical protein M1819_005381 [Sarea resinae]|nr:MAG: hypothetical protein M1819_005381 [Sarea resinae]
MDHLSSPLPSAARNGDLAIVTLLAEKGFDTEARCDWGRTALFEAVANQAATTAEPLIEMGANKEVTDSDDQTPLQLAIVQGYMGSAILLVEKGADIHISDQAGWTLLHWAALGEQQVKTLCRDEKNAKLYWEEGTDDLGPLWWSIKSLKQIFHIDIEYRPEREYRLKWEKKWAALVRLLLDNGARPDSKDIEGLSPLDCAVASGNPAIGAILQSAMQAQGRKNDVSVSILNTEIKDGTALLSGDESLKSDDTASTERICEVS